MTSYHTAYLVLLMLVITLRQSNCEDIKSLTTSTSRLLTKTISCSEHEGNGTHACHPDMGVTPNTLVTRTLNLNAEGKVTPGVEKERLVIVDVPKKDDENTPKDGNHSEKLKNRKEKIVDNIPEDEDRKNKQNTPFEEFSDKTKPLADLDHEIVVDKRSSNVEKGTLTEEVLNGKIAKSEKTNEVIPDSIAEESGVTPSVDNPTVTVLTVNTDEPITEGAVEPTVGVTEANGGASGVGANGVGASGGVAVPTLAVNEDDTKLTHKTTSIPRNPITRVAVQDCPCDITKGVCDINCCCDNDCSARDRLVFSHCLPLPILSSSQYCFSKQLIYIKNSPHYIVAQPDNSLLCIETENLRSKTNFTHFRPITTLKNFAKVFDRRKRPTWSQAVLRTSSPYSLDRLPHNQSYKVGQPIWILNATSVGVFELPHHFILSDECTAPQAIFYLEEWSSECRTQVTECTPASILSAPLYYKHFLVLASTSFENLTSVQNCTKQSCLHIDPYLCQNDHCVPMIEETLPIWDPATQVCTRVVESIHYRFKHNGTYGLISVALHMTLTNVSLNQDVRVRTRASFDWYNSRERAFRRSGNPGYRTRAPLISGTRLSFNLSQEEQGVQSMHFSPSSQDWISMVTYTPEGKCDGNTRRNLLFDINERVMCRFEFYLKEFTECEAIQRHIFKLLLGPVPYLDPDTYIASTGDPSIYNLDDWTPLLWYPSPTARSTPLPCGNLITGINLKVITAYSGIYDNPTVKIVGAAVESTTHAQLACKNLACAVDLKWSVRFVRVPNTVFTKFPEPPVYEIKLPSNFFYPFLSHAERPTGWCAVQLICLGCVLVRCSSLW